MDKGDTVSACPEGLIIDGMEDRAVSVLFRSPV